MNVFSIQQLSRYSGIKTHTIRMWEKRYKALKPKRSKGNVRSYDNNQLKKILNIVNLLQENYKISTICSMSETELIQTCEEILLAGNPSVDYFINCLIESGMNLREKDFLRIYDKAMDTFGFVDTYLKVVNPMLHKIGLLWLYEKIPLFQEHFISNIIRGKILQSIYDIKQAPTKNINNPWILFLPENEFHEIGLLIAYYLLKKQGYSVIYLGANLPFANLNNLKIKANYLHFVCFFVQTIEVKKRILELKPLIKKNAAHQFHILGHKPTLQSITTLPNMQLHDSIHSFQKILTS